MLHTITVKTDHGLALSMQVSDEHLSDAIRFAESLGGRSANQGHRQAVTPQFAPIKGASRLALPLDVYPGHGCAQHG